MKVIEIRDGFGMERLTLGERPRPRPEAGQILIRLRAASINYRDLLTVQGHYNPKQPLPLIPLSDGVGEVVEVGEGVSRFEKGARVIPIFAQRWLAGAPTHDKLRSTLGGPLDGTLAEYMVLEAEGAVAAPEHLSDEEAAALPCAGVTAWSALTVGSAVGPGDTVVTLGTGGVSLFVVQIGTLLGARVIVTSSSDDKLARAMELGAVAGINYKRHEQWSREVKSLTDRVGVDRVVDVGGGATLAESLAALGFGGQVSLVGNLGGATTSLNLIPLFMRQLRVQGILVGHREGFEAMNRAISTHRLRPVVDRVFDWRDVVRALEYMQSGRHFGKICLRF